MTGRRNASKWMADSAPGASEPLLVFRAKGELLDSSNADFSQFTTRSAYGCSNMGGGGDARMSLTTSAAFLRTFGLGSRHSCRTEAKACRNPANSSCERSSD